MTIILKERYAPYYTEEAVVRLFRARGYIVAIKDVVDERDERDCSTKQHTEIYLHHPHSEDSNKEESVKDAIKRMCSHFTLDKFDFEP